VDYARIYDQLIADRRANPPAADEYVEVHHILPRCMGGENETENLIALRPEDHFFAHLLLAKAHGGKLWAAVQIMAGARLGGSKGRSPAKEPRARERYGRLIRLARSFYSGENHHATDTSIYDFEHSSGETFSGTRNAFREKLGECGRGMDNVLIGAAQSASGWFVPAMLDADVVERLRAGRRTSRDANTYTIKRIDNHDTEFTGLRWQIADHTGISRVMVDRLVLGQCHAAEGWFCPRHNPDGVDGRHFCSGERAGTAIKEVYSFRHKDGRTFTGTRMGLVEKYGLNRQAVHNMAVGVSASSSGWFMMKDGAPVHPWNNVHLAQASMFAANDNAPESIAA